MLTFDNQKNGVQGEVIGLGLSGDPLLCPVKAITHWALHLCQHQGSPQTPLSLCYSNTCWKPVRPTNVSAILKQTVTYLVLALGFCASDVSACCLWAAGANTLLNARINPEVITLIR